MLGLPEAINPVRAAISAPTIQLTTPPRPAISSFGGDLAGYIHGDSTATLVAAGDGGKAQLTELGCLMN